MATDGFKIFNSDWSCQGYQYIMGKIHQFEGPIKMAESGLHFCPKALDCLHYYKPDPKNKYARVRGYDQIESEDDKCVTNQLEVIEEIPFEDFMKLCNGKLITYYLAVNGKKQIKSETTYKNGKKSGPCSEWFGNGQLKWKGYYLDNRLHGLTGEWNLKGHPQRFPLYEQGKLKKTYSVSYYNGQAIIGYFYSYPGAPGPILAKDFMTYYDRNHQFM